MGVAAAQDIHQKASFLAAELRIHRRVVDFDETLTMWYSQESQVQMTQGSRSNVRCNVACRTLDEGVGQPPVSGLTPLYFCLMLPLLDSQQSSKQTFASRKSWAKIV